MGPGEHDAAARPRWSDGAMPRVRQEDENLWMIYPRLKPRPHFLNRTALVVLENCDGSRSLEDLVTEVRNRFDGAPEEQIASDVRRCLHLFRTLGVVDWEPVQRVSGSDGVRIADERDFGRIAEFIRNRSSEGAPRGVFELVYMAPVGGDQNVYEDIAIRTRQFHFMELFYLLEEGDRLRGVVAMKPSSAVGQTMVFTLLLVDEGADGAEIARKLVDGTMAQAAKLSIVRARFSLREEIMEQPQRDALEQMGFSFEALLLDELGDEKHVELWSRRTDGAEGGSVEPAKAHATDGKGRQGGA